MSASKFFNDRDRLQQVAKASFTGLVNYGDAVDRLNNEHEDKLYAVISIFDNGCPDEYNEQQVGLFRKQADAAFVVKSLLTNDASEYETYHIEVVRVY